MAREKSGYRDLLEALTQVSKEKYNGKVCFTTTEAAELIGVHPKTIVANINRAHKPLEAVNIGKGGKYKSYVISITALARYFC